MVTLDRRTRIATVKNLGCQLINLTVVPEGKCYPPRHTIPRKRLCSRPLKYGGKKEEEEEREERGRGEWQKGEEEE